jgi:hypothetical protein
MDWDAASVRPADPTDPSTAADRDPDPYASFRKPQRAFPIPNTGCVSKKR